MMRRPFLLVAMLALAPFAASANTTSTNYTFQLNGPASTGVTCSVSQPGTAPLAAGTPIAVCSVAPSGWSGVLTVNFVSGPAGVSGNPFIITSAGNVEVGSNGLSIPGNYVFNVTAAP